MDGGLDDVLEDASFLYELFRATDEAAASRNPNPTYTPGPVPAPIPTNDPFAATPVSYLLSSSVSYLPAASHTSPALRFSPPREISQRPAPEVGAKRDREAMDLERLKRELNRVSKQMNELKNECAELRKDKTMKDLQIKAKEAVIQNLKKAKVSSKDVFSAGMDIDRSFHGPVNGALHAGGSSRTSTRRIDRMNDKDKDANSLSDDFYLKQGRQTDLPESLELRRRPRVDNGTSTSGVVSLEGQGSVPAIETGEPQIHPQKEMAGEHGKLKLIGQYGSALVTRVKLALSLKGLSYEYIEEDLRNKSELLLSSNPVHKTVPVLIHKGKPICESQAILQYIDEAFAGTGPSLLPADPYKRSVARCWAAYIDDKLARPWDRMFRAKTNEEREEPIKQLLAATETLEGGLRECSKGKPFFGGDSVGYVDIVLGGAVSYAKGHDALFGAKLIDTAKTPLLAAWMECFCELDAAKAVLQDVGGVVEYGKMLIAKNAARASNAND